MISFSGPYSRSAISVKIWSLLDLLKTVRSRRQVDARFKMSDIVSQERNTWSNSSVAR